MQTAANGRSEPSLPNFCGAAKVRFRDTVEIADEITAKAGHCNGTWCRSIALHN